MGDPKPPLPAWTPAPDDPGPETPSGVHRAVKHEVNLKTLAIGGFAVLMAGGSLWTGQILFIDKAEAAGRAAADAGIAEVKVDIEIVKNAMKAQQLRLENVEVNQKNTQSDIHELMVDVRAMYRSQQTGQPSPRLEKPAPPMVLPDGGHP